MDKFKVFICYGGRFEYINNMPMYLPIECGRVPLKLPVAPEKPMTARILLKNVLKKLGLPLDAPICLKYKVDQYVIDITDDCDDFGDFLCYAINNAPIEIYIVDNGRIMSGVGSNNPSSSSSGFQLQFQQLQTNDYSQPPQYQSFQQFPFPPQPQSQYQFHYHAPQNQPNNTYPTQNTQDTLFKIVEQTQYNDDVHYDHSNSKYHVEFPDDSDHDKEADYDHYDEENVNQAKDYDHPFCNNIVSDDDENEEDEEPDPRDTYDKPIPPKSPEKDVFWNMPPRLGGDEEEIKKRPVTMYEASYRVRNGQTFENKEEFLFELHTKCVEENFQIKPKKSDRKRYTAKCILPDCEWKISAVCIKDSNNFQVRKFHDVHTCSRTEIMSNNRHANKKVLGHILKELMTLEGRVYRGKEIKLDMKNRFKISLSYNQAWRAKCYAIELLRGKPEESFGLLPKYLHNFKVHNPGSVTNLRTDKDDRFVMCYMSVGATVSDYNSFS